MKTFDKKDVLSALTLEEAEQYKSKEGYFANNIKDLQREVDNNRIDTLCKIEEEAQWGLVFQYNYGLVGHDCSSLFLPADKVKEVEEKKWRPFNCIEEVFVTYNKDVGSFITYRTKDFPLRTITTTITGYAKEKNKEDQIQIGTGMIELSNCFEGIEIWNKNQWQPFGVEE